MAAPAESSSTMRSAASTAMSCSTGPPSTTRRCVQGSSASSSVHGGGDGLIEHEDIGLEACDTACSQTPEHGVARLFGLIGAAGQVFGELAPRHDQLGGPQ